MSLILLAAVALTKQTLFDQTHGIRLEFERRRDKGTIIEVEKWIGGPVGRMIESTFSEDGTLQRRVASITGPRGALRTEAAISSDGAEVSTTDNGAARPKSKIPLPHKLDITDPSINWFVGIKPEQGTTVSFMSFDPERRYWEEITVSYEGRGKIGESVAGNLVTRKSARKLIRLVLDDSGMPIVWKEGQLRLLRVRAD